MDKELKPCPCGKLPTELCITETLSGKWIEFMGDCCGEWTLETRNNYATGDAMMKNAVEAWNSAPRMVDMTNNAKAAHKQTDMMNKS